MASEKKRQDKGVTLRQPYGEMEETGRRFEDFFSRPFLPAQWRSASEEMGWSPTLDVLEKEDKFVVKVELPGVKEEDVDISVSGNMLTISGEKQAESEIKKKGYYYCESSYGSFSRSVTIPSTVAVGNIEANYDKGVLEITLPKSPEVKAKKVKITGKKKEASVQ